MNRRTKQIARVVLGLVMVAVGVSYKHPLWTLAFVPLGMVIMMFALRSIRQDRKGLSAGTDRS
jgi:1,4-dihydroxy-2-naphthoate octaprenyltransferase